MVLAQDASAAGNGVLVERAGLLVVARGIQVGGEDVGRGESVAVVCAQSVPVEAVRTLDQALGAAGVSRLCW